MPDMSNKKYEANEQPADIRRHNFKEVTLSYDKETAIKEANRCLNCKTRPCVSGCPVNVNIPEFIEAVAKGDLKQAYYIITKTNTLPAVCGRVCPQELQCESKCVRGIKGESVAIGRLERFVADYFRENYQIEVPKIDKSSDKVAILGAGAAGLTCASDLAKKGYDVTVFEAMHVAGGVLVYGIPEFRLPKAIVQNEIDGLVKLGVKIETNMVIGKSYSIDDLLEMNYKAVFVGTGAGLPAFLNIDGENLNGVFSANEYLTRINLMKAYKEDSSTPIMKSKKVAVVGGGNVAMDAARCAIRMGADEVHIIYRRSEKEMPARVEEIEHAKQEGIIIDILTNPVQIIGDENGWVTGILCAKMELSEPDESGRRRPVTIKDSNFLINLDTVIIAIGTSPNPLIKNTTKGLDVNKKGCIVSNEQTGATSKIGVFAGGDTVTGAATVIGAMGAGKKAAEAIDEYIRNGCKNEQ
ncbi:MAG: NADPH-dependent glutamate synthase [Clostridia bacterium]